MNNLLISCNQAWRATLQIQHLLPIKMNIWRKIRKDLGDSLNVSRLVQRNVDRYSLLCLPDVLSGSSVCLYNRYIFYNAFQLDGLIKETSSNPMASKTPFSILGKAETVFISS